MLQTWFLLTQTNFKKYKIIQNKNLLEKAENKEHWERSDHCRSLTKKWISGRHQFIF